MSTSEYIKGVDCPACGRKGLKLHGSVSGGGNFHVWLLCEYCGVSVESDLVLDTSNWTVSSETKQEDVEVKLWNQA